MSHNVLITGGSGYLGGTLLARLPAANLPSYGKLYALVRTDAQAEAVKQYSAEPITFKTDDEAAVRDGIVANRITVVFYLNDPRTPEPPMYFIKALAEVKKLTGHEVHFLHTSGAKLFSSLIGAPTDRPLLDTDPNMYEIQDIKPQVPVIPHYQQAKETNSLVIREGEKHGVRSYIFVPCIVYGRGEGFGNKISIQTVAIVKAAKAAGRVYSIDSGRPTWPVCHVIDNTTYYIELLRNILAGKDVDHGKNGYYLASPGSIVWDDLYEAMAVALKKRDIIADETVAPIDQPALEKIAASFEYPAEAVPSLYSGKCTLTPEHGKKLGWAAQFTPEHAIETADDEVDWILKHIE